VSEARRDPQLAPVYGGQFNRDVAPETWRVGPDIDADIKNGPANAPHKFTLSARRRLEMQSPKHAHLPRINLIVLHERRGDPMPYRQIGPERLGKGAPFIAMLRWRKQQNALNLEMLNIHFQGHSKIVDRAFCNSRKLLRTGEIAVSLGNQHSI
jgi:hypothetical protein